jgi:hypothetical protein
MPPSPNLFRTTFFFEQGEQGWSESVHSSLTVRSALIAQANNYVLARMALADFGTILTHIRISDDLVYRDILLDPIPLPQSGTYNVAENAAGPWDALDIRIQAGVTVNRSLFLRGMPNGQTNGRLLTFTAKFQLAMNKFLAELQTDNWAIKNKDRTVLPIQILSATALGVITLASPIASATPGTPVQLLGIPRSLVPGRTFLLGAGSTTTVLNLLNWPGAAFTGRGKIRQNVIVLTAITAAVCDTATERKPGRPFGLLRGRAAPVR